MGSGRTGDEEWLHWWWGVATLVMESGRTGAALVMGSGNTGDGEWPHW